jgi:hypothetical protein
MDMESILLLLDDPVGSDDDTLVAALDVWLLSDYNRRDVNIANFVYHPRAFQKLISSVEISEGDIYTSMSRILEHNLESYTTLVNKLKEINWMSTQDYLRLRPYLLTNVDPVKLLQLRDQFNMIDPMVLRKFYQVDIQIDPTRDLEHTYFGYRKAWYYLYYLDHSDHIIKYILQQGDCSLSALVDYIIWLSLIPLRKDDVRYVNLQIYYDQLFFREGDMATQFAIEKVKELEANKIWRTQEIMNHILLG